MDDAARTARRAEAIAAEVLGAMTVRDPRVVSGQFHDVVLLPGEAVVRIARRPDATSELVRSAELLDRLGDMDLPFEIPRPLGRVREVDGRAALALSWVDGAPSPRGVGDPGELRELLAALAAVDLAIIGDLLAPPHAYAGGDDWYRLMVEDVVPRLPPRWRGEARRRIEEAAGLPGVSPGLVHGDLAGDNVRWDSEGRLVGVLDWDLASAWDPAVDAACLSWHGWETVQAAVDDSTYRRARVWAATFGIEQIGSALAYGEPPDVVEGYVGSAVAWLERTGT